MKKEPRLQELRGRIEAEKKRLETDMTANIKRLVLLTLCKLEAEGKGGETKCWKDLEGSREDIPVGGGKNLSWLRLKLTPREIEICELLRRRYSSRAIAKELRVTPKTVEGHRDAIRRKLGIKNKKMNLVSFLSAIGNR